LDKMTKEMMMRDVLDPWFLAASQNIGCAVNEVKLEFTGGYNPRLYFYGYRQESTREVNARLKAAVEQHYNRIKKRFQARLKKERESKKREDAKKKAAIKQAKKIIETLGEDVYEVFGDIINQKS